MNKSQVLPTKFLRRKITYNADKKVQTMPNLTIEGHLWTTLTKVQATNALFDVLQTKASDVEQ